MEVIAYVFAMGLFVIVMVELIKEFWWVLLIGLVIFIVMIIVSASREPTPGTTTGYTTGHVGDDTPSGTNFSKGLFYKGFSTTGMVTGTYRDGKIFDGYDSGLSTSYIKATYSNGFVYEGTCTSFLGTVIGRYENGKIYKGNSTFSSDIVATYRNGTIYSEKYPYNEIGKYTGDDEGGAAAAIYFLIYR